MISEVSDTAEMVSFPAKPYSDQGELKKLWQQPLRLFRLANALREKKLSGCRFICHKPKYQLHQ